MNFEKARNSMVENQLRPNKITDPKIFEIFNQIEKEKFLKDNNSESLIYSDVDIYISNNRGYLKNLHIAQMIQYSDIKKEDKILHLGGLTGYVTTILSILSKSVHVLEEDEHLLNLLNNNIETFKLTNVKIVNSEFKLGHKENAPYDLVFIDCPLYNLSNEILNQVNSNFGRIIMIEKINENLGKGVLIVKNMDNFNKQILFDNFSKFELYKENKKFDF